MIFQLVALLMLSPLAAPDAQKERYPRSDLLVEAADLTKEDMAKGYRLLDARSKNEYQAGHIPGAYHLDYYHPDRYLPAVLPVCQNASRSVVYCSGGDCEDSELTALMLRDGGVPNEKLFVYSGGMTEWDEKKEPIETGERNSGKMLPATK